MIMAIESQAIYLFPTDERDRPGSLAACTLTATSTPHDRLVSSWNAARKPTLPPASVIPRMMMSASGKAVRDARRALKRTTTLLYRSLQRELPQFFESTDETRDDAHDDDLTEALDAATNASLRARAASEASLHYMHGWREDVTLHDGTVVTLRTLQPGDRDRLQEGFARLSPESRYQRFMTAMDTLPDAYVTYLTDIDHVHHFAVVAEIDDPARLGTRGLGIARFIELPDVENEAELAITILDEAQNIGLGLLLMDILVRAASERGFHALRAEVLPTNSGMQKLAARMGGKRVALEDGLATWRIPIIPQEPRSPAI